MIQASYRPHRTNTPVFLGFLWLLAACDPSATDQAGEKPEPGVIEATRNGPAGAPEGTCWGRTVSPAVVQTVTKQIQVEPAKMNPDGTIGAPPRYRTETTQEIVTPRLDNWFETPCSEVLTTEFISTLQRALLARGFYTGPVNGNLDAATRSAVQAYQRIDGPDSAVLSLQGARKLGLIAVPRSPD